MNRILVNIILFFSVLAFGTAGYVLIEGSSVFDGLYMTVITIFSVGYGEIVSLSSAGRLFTMVLIVIGAGFVLYIFGEVTEAVVEGGLKKVFGRYSMEKKIAHLQNHTIICGFGRIGKVICNILKENRRPFVVIENNPDEINSLSNLGYLHIEGEATGDEILTRAGIAKAKALIAVVSSDSDNVYIILSARGLNPNLFILARSAGEKNAETKLLRAGANKVISPYFIGATRMAQVLVRPTVVDFIDLTVHGGELGLRLEELNVSDESRLCNSSLQDSGIRRKHDLIVVAIKRQQGEMQFNPNPQTMILPGDTLIVLGESEHIKLLEKEL